jgi:hypothetical protein
VTAGPGLAVETRYAGWGTGMADLDNSGLPNLFFVTGNVYQNIGEKRAGKPCKTPRVVFRNRGKFQELLDLGGPPSPEARSIGEVRCQSV